MPKATDIQASDLNSLADAPGTSREYETIYILRPGITNDGVAEVNERVRGIVDRLGGKVLKVDNWGKRRLAYEIEKERKGIYLYWQYLASRGIVDEIERNLRMLDAVIRYMTVKLDADIVPDARPSEMDDEAYERAANTAADEEDLYLIARSEEGEGDDDFDGDDDSFEDESSGEDEGGEDEGGEDEGGEDEDEDEDGDVEDDDDGDESPSDKE